MLAGIKHPLLLAIERLGNFGCQWTMACGLAQGGERGRRQPATCTKKISFLRVHTLTAHKSLQLTRFQTRVTSIQDHIFYSQNAAAMTDLGVQLHPKPAGNFWTERALI